MKILFVYMFLVSENLNYKCSVGIYFRDVYARAACHTDAPAQAGE